MKIRKLTYHKGTWILRLDKQMYNWLGLLGKMDYVVVELQQDHTLVVRPLRKEDFEKGGVK